MPAGSERSLLASAWLLGTKCVCFVRAYVAFVPQALFAKRGSRKRDAVGGQHVVVVERLASLVASVFDATRFLKNAWRPFRRLFVRRLGFVVALRRKSQP